MLSLLIFWTFLAMVVNADKPVSGDTCTEKHCQFEQKPSCSIYADDRQSDIQAQASILFMKKDSEKQILTWLIAF